MSLRIFPRAVASAVCVLWLGAIQAVAQSDRTDPVQQKSIPSEKSPSSLRQTIENRFGRPDRVFGETNSLLCYRLENGDILMIVLADEKVTGIEHVRKIDLKEAVGRKVTLIGVYNGRAKADDQIRMPDGQWFWLQGRGHWPDDGKLVSATGVVKYFPGTHVPAHIQGIPPHYYMESGPIELKVLYPEKFVDR
jgi:hypothetical protein